MVSPTVSRWVGIVLAVALVAGAGFWWRAAHRPKEAKFTTTAVEKGKITARVTATGTLSALVTVQVGAQVSGRLMEIKVDFNSPVKKGQVVARLDPALFNAALEQAKANLLAAQGQLVKAKAQAVDADRQFNRNKQLRDQNLIAQADLDTSQANADAARAQVAANEGDLAQAKAQLHQAQINLDYTTIVSPTSGVVISRSVDVGQTVAATLAAPTLFTIAQDLTKMQVDTNVAESDVGKLTAGMEASFAVDAYPNERFKGKVRQIRNSPQIVQNVVTYDAVIDVDNTALRLKPGMTANVTFVYAEKDDVMRVPNAALRFRPPPELLKHEDGADGGAAHEHKPRNKDGLASDHRTVWVLRDGKPRMVRVKIGISDGTLTEIVDGALSVENPLNVGDQVITEALGAPGGASQQQSSSPFRGRGL